MFAIAIQLCTMRNRTAARGNSCTCISQYWMRRGTILDDSGTTAGASWGNEYPRCVNKTETERKARPTSMRLVKPSNATLLAQRLQPLTRLRCDAVCSARKRVETGSLLARHRQH